jgi:Flp pilus assembly protein TadG
LGLVYVIRRMCGSRRRNEDGVVAVLVAILSVVLFGFGALVIDIGHAQVVRSQGQSTVDAASLAGVRALASQGPDPVDDAVTAVKAYVKENMGITDWSDCKDPTPLTVAPDPDDATNMCISTSTSSVPGVTSFQVRVKLPIQHVPATFGGLFGVSSIGISPVAQALSGQPLPPECGPCDPALDETTGQPTPQPPPTGLPAAIRAMLPPPDPAVVPPAAPVDATGCPTTPGLFTPDLFPTGVLISNGFNCKLKPGLYVFDNTNLDVQGNLISYLAPDPANPDPTDLVLGVTLVLYGTGTLTAENGGSITPLLASLVTPDTTANWVLGDAVPGVAIVIDQFDPTDVHDRRFSLGNDFNITGSIYALDGHATWFANQGDCIPGPTPCVVNDARGTQSLIAATATDFSDLAANGIDRIPTVATDHPMAEPPPSPPHLVK